MKKFVISLIFVILPLILFSISSKLLYEKAHSLTNENEFIPLYQELIKEHKESLYGQKALLELAKIEYLKRNYEKSLDYLKQITDSYMKENIYWLAKVYLKLNKNIEAIYSAQNYIYLAPNDCSRDEDMFITIAQAFLQKKLYYRALGTLNSLRKSKYVCNRISLIVFKTAECYEKMEKYEKAIKIYKKMKIDFPYDEYTYLAQDKIYELTSLEDIQIDKPVKKKLDKAKVSPNDFDLYLQVGAYGSAKLANVQKDKIKKLGLNTKLRKKKKNGKTLYIVYAGPFQDTAQMKKASGILKNNNIDFFIYKKYHE